MIISECVIKTLSNAMIFKPTLIELSVGKITLLMNGGGYVINKDGHFISINQSQIKIKYEYIIYDGKKCINFNELYEFISSKIK